MYICGRAGGAKYVTPGGNRAASYIPPVVPGRPIDVDTLCVHVWTCLFGDRPRSRLRLELRVGPGLGVDCARWWSLPGLGPGLGEEEVDGRG